MNLRKPIEIIPGRPASDGAGVKMLRVFGGVQPERFDPFLMLDEFGSNEASDYIGGFPPHPHRGFETITYMLQGKMEHRDHMQNVGLLNDGDVQWMTAGRGVIHSEMPKQTEGRMRGFQVWLNLAAKNKMTPAYYEDVPGANLPVHNLGDTRIVAIAGQADVQTHDGRETVRGYFSREDTEPLYWDVHLPANADLSLPVPNGHTLLVYVYEGAVQVAGVNIKAQHLARLSKDGALQLNNPAQQTSRVLILAGKPLKEPIVQYGPFVMNSTQEIEQAIADYRNGALTDG